MNKRDKADFLKFIRRFEQARESFVIGSVVSKSGDIARFLYTIEGKLAVSIAPQGLLESLNIEAIINKNQDSEIISLEHHGVTFQLVVERVSPRVALMILGAGHVGHAIAVNASLLGYDVTVIDDRIEFLSPAKYNGLDIKLRRESFDKLDLSEISLRRTAAVIVTRGHQYDEQCLRAFISYDLDYIGMIGSKRRVLSIFERLIKDGVDLERLQRVRAPIGLKIGARSPQEIAISVLGEIIQVMNSTPVFNEREQKR